MFFKHYNCFKILLLRHGVQQFAFKETPNISKKKKKDFTHSQEGDTFQKEKMLTIVPQRNENSTLAHHSEKKTIAHCILRSLNMQNINLLFSGRSH